MSWTIEISPKDSSPSAGFETDVGLRVAGEHLMLLHERALFWPGQKCLIVADLHWGRTAAFLAASISPPRGSAADDLKRLGKALQRTGATRLILLGHLIGSPRWGNSGTFEALAAWRQRYAEVQVFQVRGSRRGAGGEMPVEWRIQRVREPWYWKPFAFRHVPAPTAENYTWAGHLHPAAPSKKRGDGRLPCFLLGDRVGILPAFGSFGGSMLVEAGPTDKVFTIDGRRVGRA